MLPESGLDWIYRCILEYHFNSAQTSPFLKEVVDSVPAVVQASIRLYLSVKASP